MADVRVEIPRGSDALVNLTLRVPVTNAAVNLTGASVAIWGATSEVLAALLTPSVVSPATGGVVQVKLMWDDALADLISPGFRVRVTAAPDANFPAGQRRNSDLVRLVFT